MGECLVGMVNCFGCWKNGQDVKDSFIINSRLKESIQAHASGPYLDAPKKNRFYAILFSG